ncbi:MAG: ABC transporter ATP-binding protein [Chloroflexi bacterium]|nr:ABC transporter ATP-binding protein [Chloroflexota bacterium]MCY4112151.1 ABC transporter ATP-binding protein [Chloroflexota bacterium]
MEAPLPSTATTVRRLAAYLRPHWRAQVGAIVASLLAVSAEVPVPLLTKALVDDVAIAGKLELLPPVLAALGILAVLTAALSVLSRYLFTRAGARAVNVLRAHLMRHLFRLPLTYFRRHRRGEVVTHFTSDAEAVLTAYQESYGQGIASAIQLVIVVAVIAVFDWRFGVAAAAIVPVYMLVPWLNRRHQARASRRMQDATGHLGGLATELVAGTRDLRAFNAEAWSLQRLRLGLRAMLRAGVYQGTVRGWSYALNAVFWLIHAGIFAVLADGIFQGTVTIGFALAMVGYFAWLDFSVFPLTIAYVELQNAVGAAGRLFGFIDTSGEPAADQASSELSVPRGEIEFRNVSVAFASGPNVLQGVSFTVPAGKLTALVGPTGAGKSTAVNALLGFVRPHEGSIAIDGRDISETGPTQVRRHVGVVFQDPALFTGSIGENISFGRDDIDPARIEESARIARAAEFIEELPGGYETTLGERGLGLSGGQVQRIAIARAIAPDPKILVLDEATSSLDAEAERDVMAAMSASMGGRTTIVIAHRLATVRRANEIVVLDAGRVIDRGRHDELYGRCELYRDLCDLQMVQPAAAP